MTEELIHIRCITCNKIIGNKWLHYKKLLSEGKTVKESLNTIGLTRPCCRMRMMNPFKVVTRPNRQEGLNEPTKSMESSYPNLSVATNGNVPSVGALAAMQNITGVTIVPEEESEILLPEFSELPDFSSFNLEKDEKPTRMYDAR